MNTQVTSDQIEFYRENGFLVIDNFLTGAELSVWQDAVDAAVAEHVSRSDAFHNQKGEDNYYKNVFVQCVNLWKTSAKIKGLILNPELGRLAADLAGTSGGRLYHQKLRIGGFLCFSGGGKSALLERTKTFIFP